jgi:hypothetical protein
MRTNSSAAPNPWVARAYRGLVAGFLVALVAPILVRKPGDWELVYVAAADRLRAGGDVFAWGTGYVYPPFGALLAVPFAVLPPLPGKLAWAAVNAVAGFVLLRGAWRLSGGAGLPGDPGTGRADHLAFWLAAACAGGYILDVVGNRQTDLVIVAVLVAGCELLARGRPLAAGLLFGAAAALKCTPLLFAPYLAWKRKWAAAGLVVAAAAVGLNLVPDAVYPPADGKPRLAEWGRRLLAPLAAPDFDPGMWASGIGFNHSLAGFANRTLTAERVVVGEWSAAVTRPDRPDTATLKLVVHAAQAGLLLLAVAALWRRSGRPARAAPPLPAVEFGIVLTLMLLLSPMSSKPHFCALLLPQLAIARVGWASRDRLLIALTAAAAAAGMLGNKDVVGGRVYDRLVWHGLVFGNAVLLFLGCCYARWRYAGVETAAEPVPGPARMAA